MFFTALSTLRTLFLLSVLIQVTSCSKRPDDWDRFCQIITEIKGQKISDPAIEAQMLAQKITNYKKWGKNFSEAMKALVMVDPNERYEIMQRAAKEDGRPEWQCSAMK